LKLADPEDMKKSKAGTLSKDNPFHLEKEGSTIRISGRIDVYSSNELYNQLRSLCDVKESLGYTIELENVEQLDSGGVQALTHFMQEMSSRKVQIDISTKDETIERKFDLFQFEEKSHAHTEKSPGFFEFIGSSMREFWRDFVMDFLFLVADVMYWTVVDIFRRDGRRKGSFVQQANNIGVNAISIVGPLSFIIGLVLALQSAAQIRNFGANIFIVDLTVIAMMREMGPLITAIILAGRSGSAIAAEVSTMKVTSELEALQTMALNPVRFVIVPKMHGGLVTVPFLTILADVLGILGGMLVAFYFLDISPYVFINRIGTVLENRDIIIGFFKSLVFISIVVMTGSFFGLKVEHGAEGVGMVTTKAVVVSITLVIIADSILGLIFY
jgi:phospholipid/cholesterol/gamma-HCH transport system permease protein